MKIKLFTLATAGMLIASGIMYGFTSPKDNCPLQDTPDCPKITCPLAGTPGCPYELKAALPACCKTK